jgi:acylphosphatase
VADELLPEGHVARRLRITGRVQGVGFRDWAVGIAEMLDLTGWVRNRVDGSVEALVVGEELAVDDFIRRCHSGPGSAEVEAVTVEPAQGIVGDGFLQKPTV